MPKQSNKDRIRKIINAVKKASKGDFSARLEMSGKNDELDKLAAVIQKLLRNRKYHLSKDTSSDTASLKKFDARIRDAEKKYLTIMQKIGLSYFELDLKGNFTFFNTILPKHLGYPAEELMGMNYRVYTKPENVDMIYRKYHAIYLSGKPDTVINYDIARKDGSTMVMEMSVALKLGPSGEKEGFRGMGRDITAMVQAEQAMRQREEKYRTILETMNECLFENDLAGNLTFVNDAACKLMGYECDEMIGRNFREFISPELANRLYEVFHRVYETGKPEIMEDYEIVRKDGSKRILSSYPHLVRDSNGKLIGFLNLVRDVTERKSAEDALRQSEEKYRTILETMNEGLLETDLAGNYTFVNNAACRALGYKYEDLIGRNYREIIPPELVQLMKDVFYQVYETGTSELLIDYEFVLKDGSKRIHQSHPSLIRDSSGKPIGFRNLVRDITERKEAEKALKKSEEKYRAILETMNEGLFENDLEGNFTYVNSAGCKMVGYEREELVGRNFREFSSSELGNYLYEAFHKVYETGTTDMLVEYEVKHKDGSTRVIQYNPQFIRDSDGNPVGFRNLVRDVTEQKNAEETLKKSEEKYRTILETMNEGLFENDLKGNYTYVNDAACKMVGYTKDELLGRNFRDVSPLKVADVLYEAFHRVYETGNPELLVDYEIVRKDGTKRIHQSHPSLIRDSNGKPIGFRNLVRDVTEQKNAEEALRKSEEKYRTILETMNEGFFENDLKGNLTFLNDVACKMVEYNREELIGRNYRDIWSPEVANYLFEAFHRLYETGKSELLSDFVVKRKDGSTRVYQSQPWLVRGANGKPNGFRNLVRDVTDRKNAEDALRKSEERYRMIAENVHDIICTVEYPSMRFTYVSPSISRVMGFTSEEIVNRPAREFVTPASYAIAEKLLAEDLNEKMEDANLLQAIEVEFIRKDGGTVWVEASISYNRNAKGALMEILGVIRDITERKRAEEERLKLEAQLLQAQKMESVGRLAGGVAHDFNNMLNVILGYTELIKIQLSDSDPLLKDVMEIEKAAYRSREVTRQLLAFSRKQIIAPRPVDLNDLIVNLQNSLVRLIGEDIDLRFCPGDNLWKVQFDPSQMEQIILNLGVNARDAMPTGGKLTIETENVQLSEGYCRDHLGFTPGQYVMLVVGDDGAGMDKETLRHVFEPFFTTKETGRGTGLGLAMVYGIVKQNDGFINVYSEQGRGSVFKIYVPRSMEEGEVIEKERDDTIVRGTGNILLVEDDEMVRTMTAEMLGALGYTVTSIGNPQEALSKVRNPETHIDLIITDVVMPGMSGTDLRDKMIAVRPDLKVLFMSGYTSNVIVHRGVLEENVHFLEKPFNMKDLARKVSETIRSK